MSTVMNDKMNKIKQEKAVEREVEKWGGYIFRLHDFDVRREMIR